MRKQHKFGKDIIDIDFRIPLPYLSKEEGKLFDEKIIEENIRQEKGGGDSYDTIIICRDNYYFNSNKEIVERILDEVKNK